MVVVYKAVKVYGFTARLLLGDRAKAKLMAKVAAVPGLHMGSGRFRLARGQASLIADWSASNELRITSPRAFYIAAVVKRLRPGAEGPAVCYIPATAPSSPAGYGAGSSRTPAAGAGPAPARKSALQPVRVRNSFL